MPPLDRGMGHGLYPPTTFPAKDEAKADSWPGVSCIGVWHKNETGGPALVARYYLPWAKPKYRDGHIIAPPRLILIGATDTRRSSTAIISSTWRNSASAGPLPNPQQSTATSTGFKMPRDTHNDCLKGDWVGPRYFSPGFSRAGDVVIAFINRSPFVFQKQPDQLWLRIL